MYEVYTLASYFKDNCFNVFLSCQRRYCLELKNKTLKIIDIYIYIYVCVCVWERERERERECVCVCVCRRIYQFTTTKRTRKFVTNIRMC
jgi:hypothetical protein